MISTKGTFGRTDPACLKDAKDDFEKRPRKGNLNRIHTFGFKIYGIEIGRSKLLKRFHLSNEGARYDYF